LSASANGFHVIECPVVKRRFAVTRFPRLRMRLAVVEREATGAWPLRQITFSDVASLARLMLAAYRGTADDEGETLAEATVEVEGTLEGKYGPFLSDCSFLVDHEGGIVGASIATLWEQHPLLAYTIVHPDFQRRGVGTYLIAATGIALLASGYSSLDLFVSEENEPAVALYRKLGFRVVDRVPFTPDNS
jgi:GNAT superfamily N-acetyltransferase